jgi:hypothetical protein
VFKARSAYIAVLACSAFLATPFAASAQTTAITLDQSCIDPGSSATGGGLVSGEFSPVPTGGGWQSALR